MTELATPVEPITAAPTGRPDVSEASLEQYRAELTGYAYRITAAAVVGQIVGVRPG